MTNVSIIYADEPGAADRIASLRRRLPRLVPTMAKLVQDIRAAQAAWNRFAAETMDASAIV